MKEATCKLMGSVEKRFQKRYSYQGIFGLNL